MGILQTKRLTLAVAGCAVLFVSACSETGEFLGKDLFQQAKASFRSDETVSRASDGLGTDTARTVEQDVEAPDVFSANEAGLWDGRPSLGGVWVAHPDVKDPERVIIRNPENGKFVVGALFRREREIPGPRLQISSDAAASLGMLAGAPATLNVVALRREEVTLEPELSEPILAETVEAPAAVTEEALDPVSIASAAIENAPETPEEPIRTASLEPVAPPAPAPAPRAASASKLDKPYLQVGIFSIEGNANRTADQMRRAGMIPEIRTGKAGGKDFWRVIVGPAQSGSERTQLLGKIKEIGFTDAYAVRG